MRTAFALFLLLASLPAWGAGPGSKRNREDAKRAWDAVIAAKGGRARLYSVRSLGVLSQGKAGHDTWYDREAIEFPLKVWDRLKIPEWHMVPTIRLLNGDAGIGWVLQGGYNYQQVSRERYTSGPGLVPTERGWEYASKAGVKDDASQEVCQVSERYLLETKWYQPEVVAENELRWMGKDVQVIYVKNCEGVTAAYVIDWKTRLPMAYVVFGMKQFGPEMPPLPKIYGYGNLFKWRFGDYAPVDGILMPRKTAAGEMNYEINRDYPESLFTTTPKLSDWGPWPPLKGR